MISPKQRQDFAERGWFHLGQVFEDGEMEALTAAYDRVISHPMRIGEAGKEPFEYSPLLQLQDPALLAFITDERLVRVAMELLGPNVWVYWDQAVAKPPGATSDVPWHQDNGYTPVLPHEYLTFTIAIDETTLENGCLWIQPGSHKLGVASHEPTDMLFFRGYDGEDAGVAALQKRWDVMVFSSLTMHRSGPNTSSGSRRSWIIQYCQADTVHSVTGDRMNDRLWVAKDGSILEQPYRERDFDLAALVRGAAKAESLA